jgi:hypothetical protein
MNINRRFSSRRILLLAVCGLLGFTSPARAEDRYYLIMMSAQTTPNLARIAHSFVTFVHTTCAGVGPVPGNAALEAHTISWLPATGIVRTCALFPEIGRNYELHETIQKVLGDDCRVSLWGPYEIQPDLYERALERIGQLESGRVLYKASDAIRCKDKVCNCMHAIDVLGRGPSVHEGVTRCGEDASFDILQRLSPWIVDCRQTHDWVACSLGLSKYPIIYRAWKRPVSGTILGPLYRLLGGERDLTATYGPPPQRSSEFPRCQWLGVIELD